MTFTRSRLWRTLHRATRFWCSVRRPARKFAVLRGDAVREARADHHGVGSDLHRVRAHAAAGCARAIRACSYEVLVAQAADLLAVRGDGGFVRRLANRARAIEIIRNENDSWNTEFTSKTKTNIIKAEFGNSSKIIGSLGEIFK